MIGPAPVGKSWLACALGHNSCLEDLSVDYRRLPRLFAALALPRGDGRYAKLFKVLAGQRTSENNQGTERADVARLATASGAAAGCRSSAA